MKNIFNVLAAVFVVFVMAGCQDTSTTAESESVMKQQKQMLTSQPIPSFNWSLERDLLIQLYNIRNERVSTHSVWRSNHGMVEGDCPSIGYGIPYDTSLTNPQRATAQAADKRYTSESLATIEQAEPNGIFASKNTAATWVFCVGSAGALNPVYVETKVTAYPYPVEVDYETNRVTQAGESSVNVTVNR